MARRRTALRTAAALLCVAVLVALPGPVGDDPADAALPVTPGVDGGGPRPGIVLMDDDVNNRNVDSGIQRGADGNVYVWGRTGRGVDGAYSADTIGPREREWPRKVIGLPEGAITAVSAGIYNFNALDSAGHVWGWGAYSAARDGTDSVRGRDGRLGCIGMSVQPVRLRVGSAWNGSGPLLSGVTQITGTEMAGAALTADGSVYHWGLPAYGGVPGATDGCSGARGAQQLQGLPDPSVPGNFPVYIKGGYTTFWVILESGDVYFWGGSNTYERPRAANGGTGDATGSQRTARRSTVLNAWNRTNSPDSHIVLIDSGINLGGALLSDGRVLTWGTNAGRVGGRLPNSTAAANLRAARTAGVLPNMSDVVHLAYTFTGAAMVTSDGRLYGYGDDSYECFPRWPGAALAIGGCRGPVYDTVPGLLDTDVVSFAVGQGHIRWTTAVADPGAPDGVRLQMWGQGYNPRGAIGHPTGTVPSKRPLEFRHNGSRGEPCTEPQCDLVSLLRRR